MAERKLEKLDWGILSDSIGPRVRLLRNVMTARSLAALSKFDLPTGSHTVMVLIAANEGCSQTALARQTGMNKSAVVGLLDELEKRGLARREVSKQDRRRNNLLLTAEGRELLGQMHTVAVQQEAPLRETLNEAELTQLAALLSRAYSVLSED